MALFDQMLANTGSSPLAQNGTLTFNYPTGRQAGDYIRGSELVSVPSRQTIYNSGFSVVYGATSVTLTWTSSFVTIPAGQLVRLAIQVYDVANPVSPYLGTLVTPVVHPGYIAGKTYTMLDAGTVSNTAIGAIDTVYLYPFRVFAPLAFTAAAIRLSAGGVGSSVKSGIWAHSYISGRPVGLPLFSDNAGQATTGTGQIAIPISGILDPGFYWFGTKYTGTLPTAQSLVTPTNLVPNGGVGSMVGLTFADAYANNIAALNLPEGTGSLLTTGAVPVLQLAT